MDMYLFDKRWLVGVFALALLQGGLLAQTSGFQRDQHVEAALVGEMTHLQPGVPYRVGLLLKHDRGWHTYWKSSSTGYATSIQWDLPEGFTVSELSWPTPILYDFQGFIENVYAGEVLLTATITPPKNLSAKDVNIGFNAEWLMCEKVCIPGGIQSSLSLPVDDSAAILALTWKPYFETADAARPVPPTNTKFRAWVEGQAVVLQINGRDLPDTVHFFDDQAILRPEPFAKSIPAGATSARLDYSLADGIPAVPAKLTGVLKGSPTWPDSGGAESLEISVPITAKPDDSSMAASGHAPKVGFGILLLAFVGGLILNLMPCVFPVLGIKIMGFVSQAGESRGKVVAHGLTFTAGVLASFWLLAGLLLVLRSGGSQLGWGFQLQSPGFVLVLAMVLFAFGLNLSGLFEVGQTAVGVGSNLTAKSGLSGSFFSGVLATVVATPCAAPFLAPALGAALAMPPLASISVFTLIALGLSTPYLLLSAFPGMLKQLPKPGAWMETFKQAMGFLLYATVAYLVWVLAGQLTDQGGYSTFSLLKVLLALVLLALALWIYGRWAAYFRPPRIRLAGILASVAILIAALGIGFSGTRAQPAGGQSIKWEEWHPEKAEALASEGRIVYVDFTARWCVTCQTNKAAVFTSNRVLDKLAELQVVLLKADWTNKDPEISQALAAFNRSAVPFNLIYAPQQDAPILLPEILTPGIVLEALDQAAVR